MADKPRVRIAKVPVDHGGGTPDQINIDYIKGTQFRTIRPDGAIATTSPSGNIEFAFYHERGAIPKRVTHQLNKDGTLGDILRTEGRDAVVREMDVVVSLTNDVADGIIAFLEEFKKNNKRDALIVDADTKKQKIRTTKK